MRKVFDGGRDGCVESRGMGLPLGQQVPLLAPLRRRSVLRAAAMAWIEGLEGRRLLSTTPVTLIPTADADVENSAANSGVASANYGADASLCAGGSASDQFITYLTFDLSQAASVGQAILSLNGSESVPAEGANPIGVYSVSNAGWIEGSGTHASISTPSGWINYLEQPPRRRLVPAGHRVGPRLRLPTPGTSPRTCSRRRTSALRALG